MNTVFLFFFPLFSLADVTFWWQQSFDSPTLRASPLVIVAISSHSAPPSPPSSSQRHKANILHAWIYVKFVYSSRCNISHLHLAPYEQNTLIPFICHCEMFQGHPGSEIMPGKFHLSSTCSVKHRHSLMSWHTRREQLWEESQDSKTKQKTKKGRAKHEQFIWAWNTSTGSSLWVDAVNHRGLLTRWKCVFYERCHLLNVRCRKCRGAAASTHLDFAKVRENCFVFCFLLLPSRLKSL